MINLIAKVEVKKLFGQVATVPKAMGGKMQVKTVYPTYEEQRITADTDTEENYMGLSLVIVKPKPRPYMEAFCTDIPANHIVVATDFAPGGILAEKEWVLLENASCWFDCRKGVTETAWENQVGDNDIELYNPIISKNYVEVVGSETSYGKLTHGGESGTSVTDQPYSTRYFVLKNLSGSYANWKTIIGNESAQYCCSTVAMDASGKLQFTRNDLHFGSYSCKDWHVVAIKSTKGGKTSIWVDGNHIGEAANCNGWAADTFLARGSGWYYADNNTAFRAIIISDTAHWDGDIVKNCNWLKDHYIDNYDPSMYD